ncbi:LytTR family transcriptional regulator DNA-binding domain-containing protein [Paucibacter sp. AS339]|uniref:LytR/AlgR family response regulator transcription factor n=1 Tax=Paucibacter hankyongi TaxID=3133434 RepID=UPI0030B37581
MKLKALVIEDSRLARQGLVRMLGQFEDTIEVMGQAENAAQALLLIDQLQPDLLFLDIHMPGDSGLALLEQLPPDRPMPRIIFTTAYSDYAIRSFDFNTVDYLLKPISPQRLAQAIAKLATARPAPEAGAEEEDEGLDPTPKPRLEPGSKIFIKDGEHCHLIALEDILYLESCKNYVRVFFGAGKSAYVKKALGQIEQRLPSQHFFRASRQYIVNLQAISGIAETIREGYEITMSDHKKLEISRRQALELKDLLSF